MYPGLAGVGSSNIDAPKFQFLGHVLGTAHSPGYPLYVVLTHMFGWLPIGRLAWRINLFSAVGGSVAVALMYLVARRLSCGRAAAVAGVLGLAFGPVYWAQMTIAEVHGLAVALLATILLALVTWAQTRRFRWLFLAIAVTGLALGNHLTIVTLGPALALFVILTDWRTAIRPRVPIATVFCVAAGLAQYGFILLRTHQGAPYLESRATSLTALARIVSGQSFAHSLFAFDLRTVAMARVPLATGILWREIGWLGSALALLGLVALWRTRRWADATLLLAGITGSLFFVVNYDVPDLDQFALPAIVLLWPLASIGIEWLLRGAGGTAFRRLTVLALAAALPCTQFTTNLAQSDHHDHRLPIDFFDALFARLPPSAVIASENYSTDMEVQYMLLGEEQRRHHRIASLRPDQVGEYLRATPREPVFAFRSATRLLASQGYVFAPMRLLGAPLAEYLTSIPRHRTVALAVAGPSASSLGRLLRPDIEWRGVHAFVYVGPGGPRLDGTLTINPPARLAVEREGYDLSLRAEHGRAEIAHKQDSLATADDGAALVIVAGGRAREAEALFACEGWRVPLVRRRIGLDVSRLATRVAPVALGTGAWVRVAPSAPSSRLLVWFDPAKAINGPVAELTIYASGATLTTPRVVCDGGGVARVEERLFAVGDRALTATTRDDALPRIALISARAFTRVRMSMSDFARHEDGYGCRIDLGGITDGAWLRATSRIGVAASLVPAGGIALSGDDLFWLPLGGGDDAPYLGSGWQHASSERQILLPFERPVDVEARLRVRGAGTVVLRWNGQPLARQTLTDAWRICSWRVPRGIVRVGTNEVDLSSDGNTEVSSVRVAPASVR